MDLKFLIVENQVDNLEGQVEQNEGRTVKQLEDINGKLDKIQDLLLQRVESETN